MGSGANARRVLVIGAGGVGRVVAGGLVRNREFETIGVADLFRERAEEVARTIDDPRIVAMELDASNREAVAAAASNFGQVIHAGLPRHNLAVMEACLQAGAHYIDMASDGPSELPGLVPIQHQLAYDEKFRSAGLLALLGIGVDPGVTNLLARWAYDRLSTLDEIVIYDGDDSVVEGVPFAIAFSPETSIDECLQPPVQFVDGEFVRGRALETGVTDFQFPDPIGRLTVRSVAHEEVASIPRFLADKGLRRCDFKYALSDQYVEVLRVLHLLGLDRTDPVRIDGVSVVPRRLVASLLPNPATLAPHLEGSSCVGVWFRGRDASGDSVEGYLYTMQDHGYSRRDMGANVTVWQAALPAVVAAELLAQDAIQERGALAPEQLAPEPFLERLPRLGMPLFARHADGSITPLSESTLARGPVQAAPQVSSPSP